MRVGAIALGFVVAGCGRLGFDPRSTSEPEIVVDLVAQFPGAAGWNDLLVRDVDGSVSPEPCVDSWNVFHEGCVNSGELKRITIADDSTPCADFTFGDALGAFDWTCRNEEGALIFTSAGLARHAGLADLVESDRWKDNRFEVRLGKTLRYATRAEPWWTNPVIALPDNATGPAIVLSDPGTIYTLEASRASNGYNLAADRIAVVTLGDAVLSYAGGVELNCSVGSSGTGTMQNPTHRCLLSSPWHTGQWIEGRFDGGTGAVRSDVGIYMQEPLHPVFRRVHATNHARDGIHPENGSGGLLVDIVATGNGRDGIHDHYNFAMTHIGQVLANNGRHGLFTYDGGPWRISQVTSSNNVGSGIFMDFGPNGVLSDIVAMGNGGDGVTYINSWTTPSVLHRITAVNNVGAGLRLSEIDGAIATHVVSINNGGDAVSIDDYDTTSRYGHLVMVGNGGFALAATRSDNSLFDGNVLIGGNTSGACAIASGDMPGIDNTCTSAARLVTGVDVTASMIGPLATEDGANISDRDAVAVGREIADWSGFDTATRVWGRDAAAMFAAARGPCGPDESCRIWDLDLRATDTVLRDAVGAPGEVTFVAAAPCPPAAHGDVAITNPSGPCGFPETWTGECQPHYLLNAIELSLDRIGDDDGLCESTEACVYTPSYGVPRAAGALSSCTFQDGAVRGVTLYGR